MSVLSNFLNTVLAFWLMTCFVLIRKRLLIRGYAFDKSTFKSWEILRKGGAIDFIMSFYFWCDIDPIKMLLVLILYHFLFHMVMMQRPYERAVCLWSNLMITGSIFLWRFGISASFQDLYTSLLLNVVQATLCDFQKRW